MVKKQRKKLLIEKRQSRGTAREGHIGARSKREVVTYAMARRSNAMDWAKAAGRPWSVTESLGASEGRALRARRCSQGRRQCARSARVKTLSVIGVTGCGARMAAKEKTTVSRRINLKPPRPKRQP